MFIAEDIGESLEMFLLHFRIVFIEYFLKGMGKEICKIYIGKGEVIMSKKMLIVCDVEGTIFQAK